MTTSGLYGYPTTSGTVSGGEVETGDSALPDSSVAYAVFYVETDPVYAEQTVQIIRLNWWIGATAGSPSSGQPALRASLVTGTAPPPSTTTATPCSSSHRRIMCSGFLGRHRRRGGRDTRHLHHDLQHSAAAADDLRIAPGSSGWEPHPYSAVPSTVPPTPSSDRADPQLVPWSCRRGGDTSLIIATTSDPGHSDQITGNRRRPLGVSECTSWFG